MGKGGEGAGAQQQGGARKAEREGFHGSEQTDREWNVVARREPPSLEGPPGENVPEPRKRPAGTSSAPIRSAEAPMRADDPILYAEDSDNDVFLLQRAFVRAKVPHPLVTVRDGRAAIDYLESVAPGVAGLRGTRPAPGLVLLDVKMPHLSGLEVLRWIRARKAFADLPVLMLSSSPSEQDIAPAFAAGANGYLVKPTRPQELESLVAGLKAALQHAATADWGGLPGARFPSSGGTGGPGDVP